MARRRLIRNLFFHWGVRGASLRIRIRSSGKWVPFVVTMSPTMRCNLNCRGCYSGLYSKQGELSEAELDRLFTECKSMGDYFVVLTGGEPYLLKDSLLRLFRKHNDMYFLTFTNGTMLDEPLVDELARLGNVAPALSLEGFEAETDRRRGRGRPRARPAEHGSAALEGRAVRNERHLRQRQRGRAHRATGSSSP